MTDPDCQHKYHFLGLTQKSKRIFTDGIGITTVEVIEEPKRFARFVCENCGDIKNTEINKDAVE